MITETRKCPVCDKEFTRALSKLKDNSTCSRSCSAIRGNKLRKGKPSQALLDACSKQGHKADKYTGFRKLLHSSKQRKQYDNNLTLEYMLSIWEEQNGICNYSGVELVRYYPKGTTTDHRYLASLDRIDPSKGYIKGNIQFISACMNFMKHTMTDKDTHELIQLIKEAEVL